MSAKLILKKRARETVIHGFASDVSQKLNKIVDNCRKNYFTQMREALWNSIGNSRFFIIKLNR